MILRQTIWDQSCVMWDKTITALGFINPQRFDPFKIPVAFQLAVETALDNSTWPKNRPQMSTTPSMIVLDDIQCNTHLHQDYTYIFSLHR